MAWPFWLVRLIPYLVRRRAEAELDEELRLHVALETEHHVEVGMALDEAARVARVKTGNRPLIREDTRAAWGWRWLDDLGRDVRLAGRSLGNNLTFSTTVVGTLAVALAAAAVTIAVITAITSFLWPIRIVDPGRVVFLFAHDARRPNTRMLASLPDVVDWRDQTTSFEGVAAYGLVSRNLTGVAEPRRLSVLQVTPDLPSVLGVQPALGRMFQETDSRD